jgi:hypothetical protein
VLEESVSLDSPGCTIPANNISRQLEVQDTCLSQHRISYRRPGRRIRDDHPTSHGRQRVWSTCPRSRPPFLAGPCLVWIPWANAIISPMDCQHGYVRPSHTTTTQWLVTITAWRGGTATSRKMSRVFTTVRWAKAEATTVEASVQVDLWAV